MVNTASAASPLRVLVVDDSQDTLTLTALVLEHCGFHVHTAANGKTALSLALQLPPDLVLLDLGLPQMDGFEIARALAKQLAPSRPVLVAMTGHGQREDVMRSAASGFDLHLLKPVEPALLEQLPDLLLRTEVALQERRSVRQQHIVAVTTLMRERLRMADAYIDLALRERSPNVQQELVAKAVQLCDRVEEATRVRHAGRVDVTAEICAVRDRIFGLQSQLNGPG